jgi:hypothetical protein
MLFFEFAVESFRFFPVKQPAFAQLTRLGVYKCNLLAARMIVTT